LILVILIPAAIYSKRSLYVCYLKITSQQPVFVSSNSGTQANDKWVEDRKKEQQSLSNALSKLQKGSKEYERVKLWHRHVSQDVNPCSWLN
jgi:hypothetical protein